MKIYISGPITGVDDYRKIFGEAEKALIKDGHVVLNPAILPDGFSQMDIMMRTRAWPLRRTPTSPASMA